MNSIHYIGLDVHKKTIVFCIKNQVGAIIQQGQVTTEPMVLNAWITTLPQPWIGAMEATMFSGWIYDLLKPHALELKVAHPEMLRAITVAKKKNDRADAERIVDLLRTDLLPECYMAPAPIRDLRRVLRYRDLIMRTAVKLKNRMASLLMETGVSYSKKRLHGHRYFHELLERIDEIPPSVIELLNLSRSSLEMFQAVQRRLLQALRDDPLIAERVRRLMTIQGVGEVTALTWVLEIGDPQRFSSRRKAVSYCGLCSAQHESAGKEMRGPISKKRNKHLQHVLIEAAKLAPRWNPDLAEVYARESTKGHRNQATLAVARKLVGLMLAVDKHQVDYRPAQRTAA
jgi:transposase